MKNTNKRLLSIFSVLVLFASFVILFPQNINAATLTSASATLGNPRFSFRAGANTGTAGTSTVSIDASGNPDITTGHLFPGDTVCFTNATLDGCIGNTTYTVQNIIDGTNFNLSNPLSVGVDANGYVIASQSATTTTPLTISFTTVSTIPVGGSILITIPMADSARGNDGMPDTNTTVASNGFDLSGLATSNISVTGCTDANWNVAGATITPGSGTTDHTISIPRQTASCAGGSPITVTIKKLVNPAPISSGHTQGVAENYKIQVATRDGTPATLDSANLGVVAVEGVLVSATVDQTLSFTVAGITADSGTYCGVTRTAASTDSTATTIPWGTIATANTFLNAVQRLTVSTNAGNGYTVKIEENDQMGMNGIVCTGAGAGESVDCIKDTQCDSGTCTESTSGEWNTATNNGLGYSIQNVSGTDAAFVYNESSHVFSSKQIADQEATETKQTIMSNAAPVSNKQIDVCYRISVSGTQPAGYYYNKVKYTATATF